MTDSPFDADQARRELYEVMRQDLSFEDKAEQALSLGEQYLRVDNGHLTKIDSESDYWKTVASTDPSDGQFPVDLVLDLQTTYCRRTLSESPVALHDASDQGWEDDPAYQAHELECYHGTLLEIDGEPYGTLCFVSSDSRPEPFSDEETMFAELIARTLEHELKRDRLESQVDRLDQFASVVSHDLRNPLNVAQAHVELERERGDSENLTSAAEAHDRMESMIDSILTIARQGPDVTETTPHRLSSIADSCWGAVATAEAELVVDDDVLFHADPQRITQLFENLFRNSLDHAGPDVTVTVGALGDDGFYLEDDGSGILPDRRDEVFEAGCSTGDDGVGLGLSIVEGVASAHGWTVLVDESEEGGARFEFADVVVSQDGRQ